MNRISLLVFAQLLAASFVIASSVAIAQGAGEAAGAAFDLFEFAVQGNSKLTDAEIERAVTPFLGERKTGADVEGARAALERTYQDAGYLTVLVSVPEQEVSAGVVVLRVAEGVVDRLRVRGAEYHLSSGLKEQVPEIAEGSVPYFPQMQRELDAVNRNPNLKATPVLKPGRAPGTVAVQLDVQDEFPLHGSAEISNRQSANTTPMRFLGTLRYDNLFQRRHTVALVVAATPQSPEQVKVAALTYLLPVGADGDVVQFFSLVSRSKLSSVSGAPGLGLLGNTNIYGARYGLRLRGSGAYTHSLNIGIDYKDDKASVVTTSTGDQVTTPISYAPLVAAYNGSLTEEGSSTSVEVTTTVGLRGLFGNRDAEFNAKRLGASADFITLRAAVKHAVDFGRWNLGGKIEAQFASGPLVTFEQYLAGGAESVRGYLEAERGGDAGLRYSFEARSPRLPLPGGDGAPRLNAIAFVDGASLRTFEPVLPTPSWRRLMGAGVGLRMVASRGFKLELDWAHAYLDGDLTRAGSNRIHARLLWEL